MPVNTLNREKFGLLFAALTLAVIALGSPVSVEAAHPSFKSVIYPILEYYCLECHQPGGRGYEKSGFDMRTYESLMKGTKHGPVVVPGDAFSSNLMVLIEGRGDKSLKMPHNEYRLGPSKTDRQEIRAWITDDAKDDDAFHDTVHPSLGIHCLECHQQGGRGYDKSGLDMSTYETLMKGTKHGPVVVPGDAFSSNLMVLIEGRADKSLDMPHFDRGDLSRWEKHLIRAWIIGGAKNN